jgi:hypothetical protein
VGLLSAFAHAAKEIQASLNGQRKKHFLIAVFEIKEWLLWVGREGRPQNGGALPYKGL